MYINGSDLNTMVGSSDTQVTPSEAGKRLRSVPYEFDCHGIERVKSL